MSQQCQVSAKVSKGILLVSVASLWIGSKCVPHFGTLECEFFTLFWLLTPANALALHFLDMFS